MTDEGFILIFSTSRLAGRKNSLLLHSILSEKFLKLAYVLYWKVAGVIERGGLEIRCTVYPYRGFESLTFRCFIQWDAIIRIPFYFSALENSFTTKRLLTRNVSPLMPINCLVNQRDKETKRQRDEERKSRRDKKKKGQRKTKKTP